jgi:hypothetical protein
MDWASIESITRSEHGQDGVYFLDNGEEIRVLKAPENPSTELFLTLLATEFRFSTPTIEVVNADCSAYKTPHKHPSNALVSFFNPNLP